MPIPQPRTALLTALATAILCLFQGRLESSEIGAVHLVYEKAVKMKKAEVSLLLPYLDQSRSGDTLLEPRRLSCSVGATGKAGLLRVRGKLVLRLLGDVARTSSPWRSSPVTASLDENGAAQFEAEAILGLVDQASADGARVDLFQVVFDGGRGKKAGTLTVDCLHEAAES
jgi:hypothetical protein